MRVCGHVGACCCIYVVLGECMGGVVHPGSIVQRIVMQCSAVYCIAQYYAALLCTVLYYTHAHTHAHTYASTRTHAQTIHTLTHIHIHTHAHTYTHTRTYIHTHAHSHAHTHTRTHTNAHRYELLVIAFSAWACPKATDFCCYPEKSSIPTSCPQARATASIPQHIIQ
jgi:hypothetical protein